MELTIVDKDQSEVQEEPVKVHTSCKNCLFATWGSPTSDDEATELVQTGCQLGRLETFRAMGEDVVLDVIDETGTGFCIISDRVCNAHRDDRGGWLKEGEDAVAKVREELRVRMAVVVLLHGEASEDQVRQTARALFQQEQIPEEVFFVNNQKLLKPGRLNAILWQELNSYMTWRIVDVVGHEAERNRAIDQAVAQVKFSLWFAVFNVGYAPLPSFITSIESAINERLERFSVLTPNEDGNGLVVHLPFYKHPLVGGNEPIWVEHEGEKKHLDDIVAKAVHMATLVEQPHMVRPVADIVAFQGEPHGLV